MLRIYTDNSGSITNLVNDLNAKLAGAFPQTPNPYNTASNWTMLSGGTETTLAFTAVSTYVFQYTATVGGTPTTFTVTYTNFDMNAGTAQFTESDGASMSSTRTFNKGDGLFQGGGVFHNWRPPANFIGRAFIRCQVPPPVPRWLLH